MKLNRLLLAPLLLISSISCSQKIVSSTPESIESKIDALFQEWNHDNTPGCICEVIRDGKVIYCKGFGMANLETKEKITAQTRFELASCSKQFTAACSALLMLDGKLSEEDDIRKYLPEMHDFEAKITVADLIHHTSGIRDDSQLLWLLGSNSLISHFHNYSASLNPWERG